jgi:glyoxylase-like metal-dependent hydrolase (beta-lactamase superfamily II)/rhodanese-related sulfurtransferase
MAAMLFSPRQDRREEIMVFQQLRAGGCLSYVLGCERTCAAAIIDPEASLVDRYLSVVARDGLRLHYLIDTHTHADHFSASRTLAQRLGIPVVMHRQSPAPFVDIHVDDGEMVALGDLRLSVLHTPGHTLDSMCLLVDDRVLTGDTLLIGATGRTDLPTGDPDMLYDSLFDGLLHLDDDTLVFPAHDYKERESSTIGRERSDNPRLQRTGRAAFVELMRALDLQAPTHLTEALRTNQSGGRTVAQLIAAAREKVPFMSMAEVQRRIGSNAGSLVILDVREQEAFSTAHVPGAINIPRGQLELRVNDVFKDPSQRIVVYCELGIISTLAAATLKDLGFDRAVALDGGFKAWRDGGFALEA